ncbi:MAG: phospho-sugar mutase [Clostridia bacterium]|nr:phospho-sugar mutase [Clostridia bacterium]
MSTEKYMTDFDRWLGFEGIAPDIKAELISIKDDKNAIAERFAAELEFGTGGMRGILGAGIGRMNIYTVMRVSLGFAEYIKSLGADAAQKGVVISHDNRRYSREFALATAGVFAAAGVRAYIFDSLRPTPMLSFSVRKLRAAGGVMITASHNPPEYNGYKIYDSEGCQLSLEESEKVIRLVSEVKDELAVPCLSLEEAGDKIVMLDPAIDDEYAMRVENISISRDRESAAKLKVVYSPQHGTGNVPVRRVLADCGYEVIPVLSQCDPDPDFSGTESPNPESPKAYTEALKIAKETGADIVITTDPDCDRLGVAALNNAGEMVLMTGNQSAAVLLEYILSRRTTENSLPADPYMLTTIVTSDLGDRICEGYGVKVEKTLTGFKFIGEKIAKHRAAGDYGFVFGYEESYGCLVSDFVRDKDGVQASLMLCEAAAYYKNYGLTLIDILAAIHEKYGYFLDSQSSFYFPGLDGKAKIAALTAGLRADSPAEVGGVKVVKVEDYLSDEMKNAGFPASDVLRFIFEDGCWVAVRPSGTEPKCKFYYCVCAPDKESAENKYKALKTAFEPQI